MRVVLLVRQLGLFLHLALRARREQIHEEIGQPFGELAARHHLRDAGGLGLAGELFVDVGQKPDDRHVARRCGAA